MDCIHVAESESVVRERQPIYSYCSKVLEEKDLRKLHEKEYEAYQKKVPMIVPFTGKGN